MKPSAGIAEQVFWVSLSKNLRNSAMSCLFPGAFNSFKYFVPSTLYMWWLQRARAAANISGRYWPAINCSISTGSLSRGEGLDGFGCLALDLPGYIRWRAENILLLFLVLVLVHDMRHRENRRDISGDIVILPLADGYESMTTCQLIVTRHFWKMGDEGSRRRTWTFKRSWAGRQKNLAEWSAFSSQLAASLSLHHVRQSGLLPRIDVDLLSERQV